MIDMIKVGMVFATIPSDGYNPHYYKVDGVDSDLIRCIDDTRNKHPNVRNYIYWPIHQLLDTTIFVVIE